MVVQIEVRIEQRNKAPFVLDDLAGAKPPVDFRDEVDRVGIPLVADHANKRVHGHDRHAGFDAVTRCVSDQ